MSQHLVEQDEQPGEEMVAVAPVESARAAGLRYVSDTSPGIRRRRAGKHFSYLGLDGKAMRDQKELQRIRALAIPPAWNNVWICPDPRGHIQASGRDARGRKQYRYHSEWRKIRDETKYNKLIVFGQALPRIRERVNADLSLPGLPREKVLAVVVRLLDTLSIRVGNEEYARENKSFGLTTLRNRHVEVTGATIHIHFRGKRGIEHDVGIQDKRLARIIKQCQDLPGHELFQYLDESGKRVPIDSDDVNEYLRSITGKEFTAKDFRTWSGTVITVCELTELGDAETQTQTKKHLAQAIETAAKHLGNTPTICRKCYVHPEVINSYLDGKLLSALKRNDEQAVLESLDGLRPEEIVVMKFLQE
jgi:DNA topoisomerase-1